MVHWLVRTKRLAQNSPSSKRVILGLAVVGICLAIIGFEALGLWPEWATLDPQRVRIR